MKLVPIAYISQDFSPTVKLKLVYERELLDIVFVVNKWRHYLTCNPFIISTDQRSLKYLLDQKYLLTEQQKLASKLLGLNSRIEYKLGWENKVADALSCRP